MENVAVVTVFMPDPQTSDMTILENGLLFWGHPVVLTVMKRWGHCY